MKLSHIAAILATVAVSAAAADLVITSFDHNGSLTWTNSLSNAVYQVQWANSVTGAWTNFQALAKLDSIQTTDKVLTATVPMFYRVAAQQTPPTNVNGVYQYEGYNADGNPLVVGWLSIGPMPDYPDLLSGTWALGYVGDPTCADPRQMIGEQIGKGVIEGAVVNGELRISLTPNIGNYYIHLTGSLQSGRYTGNWVWMIFTTVKTNGTFSTDRIGDCPR